MVAAPWAYVHLVFGLSNDYYQFVIQNGTQVTPGSVGRGGRSSWWNCTVWASTPSPMRSVPGPLLVLAARTAAPHRVEHPDPGQPTCAAGTVRPDRPADHRDLSADDRTQASTGDAARPACRADQWRPVFSAFPVAFDFLLGHRGHIEYLHDEELHLRTPRPTVELIDGTAVVNLLAPRRR